jgi:hypothetical protein
MPLLNKPVMVLRLAFLLAIPALFAACTPQEPEVSRTQVQYPFIVRTVEVKILPDAPQGRFKEDLALRENARSVLENTLEQRFRIGPGGSTKARAGVTLTTMRLKVAGSRTFGATNALAADIKILDRKGKVLAHNPSVRYSDQAAQTNVVVNGNPVIGILVSLARNSQQQEVGKDLQMAIGGFSGNAVNWLAKGRGVTPLKPTKTAAPISSSSETSSAVALEETKPVKKSRLRPGTCLTKVWDFKKNTFICENDPKASKGYLSGVPVDSDSTRKKK